MLFADAPLTEKSIGRYISAKIATKRKTLKQRPTILKDITGEKAYAHPAVDSIRQADITQLLLDDEVTTAIKVEIYDGFFDDLAILDQKAGALASVIAIITAFVVFLSDGSKAEPLAGMIAIALGAALASLVLTISVLTVRWSSTSQLEERTLDRSILSICRVRNWRTIRFRVALYLAFAALILLTTHILQTRPIAL